MCSQNLSTAVKSMLVQSPKISTTVQNNSTNAFTVFTAFCISVNIFIVVLQRLQSMILCLLFFLAASPEHAAEGKHNWTSHQHQGVRHRSQAWRKVKIMAPWWSNRGVLSRDVHADVFSDAHQCVCRILRDIVRLNAEVDAEIRIHLAIPSLDNLCLFRRGSNSSLETKSGSSAAMLTAAGNLEDGVEELEEVIGVAEEEAACQSLPLQVKFSAKNFLRSQRTIRFVDFMKIASFWLRRKGRLPKKSCFF